MFAALSRVEDRNRRRVRKIRRYLHYCSPISIGVMEEREPGDKWTGEACQWGTCLYIRVYVWSARASRHSDASLYRPPSFSSAKTNFPEHRALERDPPLYKLVCKRECERAPTMAKMRALAFSHLPTLVKRTSRWEARPSSKAPKKLKDALLQHFCTFPKAKKN